MPQTPKTPGSRAGRRAAPSEEEVRRCWDALTLEQRQQATVFHDSVLVKQIMEASQELHRQHTLQAQLMQHHGISLANGEDPFLSSELLTNAFQFSWESQRNVQNPNIVVLDKSRPPAIALKANFISRPDFFDIIKEALPDLCCARTGRVVLPRARWKEIWSFEPSSIAQMKAQLAKLVEQALWAVPIDFPTPAQAADGLTEVSAKQQPLVALEAEVVFEPWMAQDSDPKVPEAKSKKSSKTKKKKTKTLNKVDQKSPGLSPKVTKGDFLPGVELEAAEEEDDDDDEEPWFDVSKKKKTKAPKVDETPPKVVKEDFLQEMELEITEECVHVEELDVWKMMKDTVKEEEDTASAQDVSVGSTNPKDELACASSANDESSEDASSQAQLGDCTIQFQDHGSDTEIREDEIQSVGLGQHATLKPAWADIESDSEETGSGVCEEPIKELTFSECSSMGSRVQGERFILPPQTPPSSPVAAGHDWQPRQLVCYIWNQTSRLSAPEEQEDTRCSNQPQTPASRPFENRLPQTPSSLASRGGWNGGWRRPGRSQLSSNGPTPKIVTAVVKNTFIDIEDDATDCPTSSIRSTKSLSPSHRTPCVTPCAREGAARRLS